MSKYFVNIVAHPLGVEFTKSLSVCNTAKDSIGERLGISPGDELVALNGQSIKNIDSESALRLFNNQPVPFTATFKKPKPYRFKKSNGSRSGSLAMSAGSLPKLPLYTSSIDSDDIVAKSFHFAALKKQFNLNSESNDNDREENKSDFIVMDLLSDDDDDDDDDICCEPEAEYELDSNRVDFDVQSVSNESLNRFLISSNGFKSGKHEWTIEILECDVLRQEIGIVSVNDDKINVNVDGLCKTSQFGARAIYGNMLENNSFYYASYNENNAIRLNRDLSSLHKIGWCEGDKITIYLDLDHAQIKFYLNGKKVRKTVSIQKNKIYYPIISYCGRCRYQLIDYK